MARNNENNERHPLYLNYTEPIEKRVDDLVSRLTLEEKISQLTLESAGIDRLNIPKYHWWGECLHGVALSGIATVFPQAIGLAATWNLHLMQEVANAISDEARAIYHEKSRKNISQGHRSLTFFSPNVNIFRDPRWGRGQETYGEDPFLTSRMGVTFINALQGNHPKYLKVVATPKHYAVHSGPDLERHHFNAIVSKKDLWETYLPAFKACIQESRAFSIMPAYNRVNGETCCASKTLLVDILRGKWNFQGYVVTDANSVSDIFLGHNLVNTAEEAVAMALNMGSDLLNWLEYSLRKKKEKWQWIKSAVEKDLVSEDTINQAVMRLFEARFRLGMFDPLMFVPYAQIPHDINDCEKHRALALKAARESMVLLKNEKKILPLSKNIKSVAIIGPNVDNLDVLLGNYNGTPSKYTTPLQGIKSKVSPETVVNYAKGCPLKEKDTEGFKEAVEIAKKSEVIIMILGISPLLEGEEGQALESDLKGDRVDINLPKIQEELLKTIHATHKPIVLALTSGSALAVNFAKENVSAIVQAWYPGEEGGTAIADVIFGDYNPAGRLPVTFYKSADQLPDFRDYSMKGRTYRFFKEEALFPFGYGLSYTKFKYSNLQIAPEKVITDKNVFISVEIENVGEYLGDEVVQLYVSNLSNAPDLPIRELQGFKRITLKKDEKKVISFTLKPSQFSRVDDDGKRVVEPGKFAVFVGGCQPGFIEDGVNGVDGIFEVMGDIIELD